jgi:hypothetical protein
LQVVEAAHPAGRFNHNCAIIENHVLALADPATLSDLCNG